MACKSCSSPDGRVKHSRKKDHGRAEALLITAWAVWMASKGAAHTLSTAHEETEEKRLTWQ